MQSEVYRMPWPPLLVSNRTAIPVSFAPQQGCQHPASTSEVFLVLTVVQICAECPFDSLLELFKRTVTWDFWQLFFFYGSGPFLALTIGFLSFQIFSKTHRDIRYFRYISLVSLTPVRNCHQCQQYRWRIRHWYQGQRWVMFVLILLSSTGWILHRYQWHRWWFLTGVIDTCEEFITGVNDTGLEFVASI